MDTPDYKDYKPITIHEYSLGYVKIIGGVLVLNVIYKIVKNMSEIHSFQSAFQTAFIKGTAPVMLAFLMIPILIFFFDWAFYMLVRTIAMRFGTAFGGTITKEIEKNLSTRGGSFHTYRYVVTLDDGSTVKSMVYAKPIFKKECTVYRYLWFVILSDVV